MERSMTGHDVRGGRRPLGGMRQIATAALSILMLMLPAAGAWASDAGEKKTLRSAVEKWRPGVQTTEMGAIAPRVEKTAPSTRSLLLHYGAGASADLLSTEWGIAQGSNVWESNPLFHSRGSRVAAKLIEVGGATWLDRKLSPRKPRLAKVLRWTCLASRVALTIHNVHVGLAERNGTAASQSR
jgi:hypothetical protein